mmetsp:Transcript_126718/g.253284  ORF Transcript_126718/g.253284 Transcript_126718/m.253284 type:complete len:380 (-) Transcript_126718:139-1278(-)
MGCGCLRGTKRTPLVEIQQPKPNTVVPVPTVPDNGRGKCNVFCSHQHTELALKKRIVWHGPDAVIRASMPPFNKLKDVPIEDDIMQVNVPVFGPNILNAIMEIFIGPATCNQMKNLANKLGVRIPVYAIDTFLQKRIVNVKTLLDVARARPDCAEGPNVDAITKLERWVDAFHNLSSDSIPNLDAWHRFVEQYVPPGWQLKLHFDHVLSNFGFQEATAKELQHHPIEDHEGKATTLQHSCLRWLAKSFAAYGPKGCLTDVANLVFAMQTDIVPSNVSETDVVACLKGFNQRLATGRFNGLWIPDMLLMDCELDDTLVWLLLDYINQHTQHTNPLKVLAQLPQDPELDWVAEKINVRGSDVFRDPGSRNAEAVKHNFSWK